VVTAGSERGRVAGIIAVIGERCEDVTVREGEFGALGGRSGWAPVCGRDRSRLL
jgi:hypothetical protein